MIRCCVLVALLVGCADDDADNDGIPDRFDECPEQREDFDDFEDEDGCPDEWRIFAMPEPRLATAAGALGSRLVLAGGFAAGITEGAPITRSVLTFDTLAAGERDPWGALPDLPVAWTHANIAVIGGVVFALGGLDGRSFVADGRCFVLEQNATEWTEIAPMAPEDARGAAAVVVSPGHIFLLGGASTSDVLATNLDFDLETRTFSRMPVDLPIARSHAAAIRRFDGTFIVAGGLGGLTGPQPLDDVWALPQDATVWINRAPMPTPRGGCAYGELYGNLVCIGGEAGLEALDVVELYNFPIDTWETLEPMPGKRAGARGLVVANRVYVPGGSESLELAPTTTLFEFSLTAR